MDNRIIRARVNLLYDEFYLYVQIQPRFIVHFRLVSKLQESKFLIYRKNALKAQWFGIFSEPITVTEHSFQRSTGCYPLEDFYRFRFSIYPANFVN